MIRPSPPPRPGGLHHAALRAIQLLQSLCFTGVFLLCLCHPAWANGVDIDGFLRELEMKRGKINTFSARFVQKRTLAMFDEIKISKGILLYKAPRQMIWKYTEPDKTQMRLERDSVAFYFPDLEQIEIYPADRNGGNANFFFAFEASADELKESFEVAAGAGGEELTRIDLTPRAGQAPSQLKGLTLWLDDSDYLPRRIFIRDTSGDTTEIELSEVRVNEPIADEDLQFDAPQGTKIIENEPGGF